MFETMNKSSKAIISEVVRGKIARVTLNDERAEFNKYILLVDNKITVVEECLSIGTQEHLRKPKVETVSKTKALALCEQLRVRNLINIVSDEFHDSYLIDLEKIQEGIYEY